MSRLLILVVLLSLLSGDRASFRVLGQDEGRLIVERYTPAAMEFVVVKGKVPTTGNVLDCSQRTGEGGTKDAPYHVLLLDCKNGLELKLVDIDLVH